MKDTRSVLGVELGASYCASLREHLNKTAVSPEGGPGQQARRTCTRGSCVHICARMRTRAASAPTGAERAAPEPGRLRKVLGDSQSWEVVSGKGRDPGLRLLLSGAFGQVWRLWLEWAPTCPQWGCSGSGWGGRKPTSPCLPSRQRGPAWVEVLCRPSNVLKPNASQSRENGEAAGDLALDAGRKQGPCQALEQGPGCRTVPSHRASTQDHPRVSRGGPGPGCAGRALEVRRRSRLAGQRVSARCTACLRAGGGVRRCPSPFPHQGRAPLTLGHILHVGLVRQQPLQPLHEQQGLVVALNAVLPPVEHLVQGGRLHLCGSLGRQAPPATCRGPN